MKLDDTAPRVTRQMLADPHIGVPHEDRLRAAGAIDLRDNARVVDLGNGYARAEPIDPTKRWGDPPTESDDPPTPTHPAPPR